MLVNKPGSFDFRGAIVSWEKERLDLGLDDTVSVEKGRSTFLTKGRA